LAVFFIIFALNRELRFFAKLLIGKLSWGLGIAKIARKPACKKTDIAVFGSNV